MIVEALEELFKQLNNPWVGILLVTAIGGFTVFYVWGRKNPYGYMRVLQFSDVERLVQQREVVDITSKVIKTKGNRVFQRRAPSWTLLEGRRKVQIWLGHLGNGVTYQLESTSPDGKEKYEKMGTLWEGLQNIFDEKTSDFITDLEAIQKIKDSKIKVAVGIEPINKDLKKWSDEGVESEANKDMATLIAVGIKEKMMSEDWIRNGGLIAVGVAGVLIAQAMGVM